MSRIFTVLLCLAMLDIAGVGNGVVAAQTIAAPRSSQAGDPSNVGSTTNPPPAKAPVPDPSASDPSASDLSSSDPSASDRSAIDVSKLGISFDRVRMELALPPPSKTLGLKIHETVEVVGTAPKLNLWDPKTAALTSAAVPYGAPTQKDIMKLIVPKEFQNYPFDLNALMQWLAEHLGKKSDE